MVRRRVKQWGVTFRVARPVGTGAPLTADEDGVVIEFDDTAYKWSDDGELIPSVSPRDRSWQPIPSGDPHATTHQMHHFEGFKVCRDALRRFVRLARDLEQGVSGVDGGEGGVKQLILDYANEFACLYGGYRQEMLDDWLVETATFLDAWDIHERKFQRFAESVDRPMRPRSFRSRRPHSKGVGWHPAMEWALNSKDIERQAIFMLSHYINRRLTGGLSFEGDYSRVGEYTVVPKNLISMLYLRLWIDVDAGEEPDERYCAVCQDPIPEGRNRKARYCSEACKQQAYRKRSGVSRT